MEKNPVVLRNNGEVREEAFLKGNLLKDQMSGATEKNYALNTVFP